MKKTILIVVGACLLILAALSLAAAITVTGSGFLDLSNITRAVFFLAGAVFAGWDCLR